MPASAPAISSATFFAANSTQSYAVTGSANETQSYTSSDAEFASFIGTGTVGYTFDGIQYGYSNQQGAATADPDLAAAISVTVTYTYDEVADVPVPAALPLLASAFGVLGLIRLRRKA